MKNIISIISLFLLCNNTYSQVDWELFTVYDATDDTTRSISQFEYVELADLDNDGKIDVIAASIREINGSPKSMLMWFRNEGGKTFSEPIIIFKEQGALQLPYIDVGDIDNDGDVDIAFVTSEYDDQVLWFENINGAADFEQHFITNMFYENHIELLDLDSDGDLDVLTAGTRHTEWYMNTDGQGAFLFQERFNEYFNGSRHVITAEDFDNDGNLDIIYWRANGGTWGTDKMYIHYGLNSNGSFGSPELMSSDNPYEIVDVEFIDINGDQEKDIVYAHGTDGNRYSGEISWREVANGQILNTGGVLGSIYGLTYLEKLDIDNDGDLDIISSAAKSSNPLNIGQFLIFLNDGNGQFESAIEIDLEEGVLKNVKVADLDNDGTFEIVGVTRNGLYGVELMLLSSLPIIMKDDYSLLATPNPTFNQLKITPQNSIVEYYIEILDLVGNQVYSGSDEALIELGHLSSGTYLLSIQDKRSNKKWMKKIIKM